MCSETAQEVTVRTLSFDDTKGNPDTAFNLYVSQYAILLAQGTSIMIAVETALLAFGIQLPDSRLWT